MSEESGRSKTMRAGETAERPSWDEYFISIANKVGERSTCLRRRVGAIVVKDRRILSTGYNGAPSGFKHCGEVGCLREKQEVPAGERHELCRGVHAEQNAIVQAAAFGVSIRDSTLYCTHFPCSLCAKLIINAGIRRVVVARDYPDDLSKNLLREALIEIQTLP
jgi:dCMP deaminase